MHQEHRDLGAVLRADRHLAHLEPRRDPRRPPPGATAPRLRSRGRCGTRRAARCTTRSRRRAPCRPTPRRRRRGCRAPAERTSRSVPALVVGQSEPGRGALEVAERQVVGGDAHALEHRVGARGDDLPPPVAIGALGVHHVEPVGRRVEVGAHEEAAVSHLALERGGEVFRDRHRRGPAPEVLKVEVGLIEGAGDSDHQPAPIGRDPDARPVLLLGRLEDQRIAGGIGPQAVEVDRPVVVLLALGHLTGRGVAGVVEAPVPSGSQARSAARVRGIRSPRSAPESTSRTWSTLCSLPFSDSPYASSRPSSLG